MKKTELLIIVVVLALASGCSRHTHLSGKVTFADNNEPVTNGFICFENDTVRSRAFLDENGSYVVSTLKEKDGIPQGTYRVSISGGYLPPVIPEGMPAHEVDYASLPLISEIDEKFANPSTSGLTVTIGRSKQVYDVRVERAGR